MTQSQSRILSEAHQKEMFDYIKAYVTNMTMPSDNDSFYAYKNAFDASLHVFFDYQANPEQTIKAINYSSQAEFEKASVQEWSRMHLVTYNVCEKYYFIFKNRNGPNNLVIDEESYKQLRDAVVNGKSQDKALKLRGWEQRELEDSSSEQKKLESRLNKMEEQIGVSSCNSSTIPCRIKGIETAIKDIEKRIEKLDYKVFDHKNGWCDMPGTTTFEGTIRRLEKRLDIVQTPFSYDDRVSNIERYVDNREKGIPLYNIGDIFLGPVNEEITILDLHVDHEHPYPLVGKSVTYKVKWGPHVYVLPEFRFKEFKQVCKDKEVPYVCPKLPHVAALQKALQDMVKQEQISKRNLKYTKGTRFNMVGRLWQIHDITFRNVVDVLNYQLASYHFVSEDGTQLWFIPCYELDQIVDFDKIESLVSTRPQPVL